jgi:hypothetical protein
MGKLAGDGAAVVVNDLDEGPAIQTVTAITAAGAVYLFCIPESDYVSAQTLICGGGFFG